ncbi:MAG: SurA N-terminal domain-containing protein [Rubrivivax sp.]|nr:SurA N-terminal domain-containing protein [Rubrivivax sp.]
MFEFVRNNTRMALGFVLLLIIPSFIFFGVDGYSRFTDGSNASVAKVDGVSITRGEWENAHQRVIDSARRQNPTQDVQSLDTPTARRDTLDRLVTDRVLLAAATRLHLAPTDERLRRLFATDPQYAALRNPDGSVNRELLAMQGMSSEGFAQQLRQELSVQQLLAGIGRTAFAPPSIAAAGLDPLLQRREVQIQRFDPAAFRARATPSEAEVEAFYKTQQTALRAPEQADVEYVLLDLAALAKGVALGDDELRKFYADNAARYSTPEERRASHVLVKVDKNMPAAAKEQAKLRAEELLVQARKNPAAFAELARNNSQDPGSAAQGGDLDFFGRGAMVKPFETAAFSLKPGEVSEVFETDFGYHFLTVTGMRGGDKKPFEAVRAEIDKELRNAKAKAEWPKMAEQFTNTVYEQSDSLQPVVDKLKLGKKTATVQRTPAPGASGPWASTKLLDAVFGNEAVANKRNTDAVEVAPNQLVSARVVKHTPSRTLEFAEVKDTVRERLIVQQASALARKEGEARVAALKQTPAEALPLTLVVSRAQSQGAPRAVIDAVMRADASKLPAIVGVDLQGQGYLVLRITQVLPREAAAGSEAQLQGQFAQAWAAAEAEAYIASLKKRVKADVKGGASMAADAASAPLR